MIASIRRKDNDSGFTLVELLVVIIIIGIIAAVAIPAFMNQRARAAEATVKSDLKGASIAMQDAYVPNQKYQAFLPNYNRLSPDSRVTLDINRSNEQDFCLRGTSESRPSIVFYYDSAKGGLLPKGVACSGVGSGSGNPNPPYSAALSSIKVLVIENRGGNVPSALANAGITDVTMNTSASTLADLQGYDLIVNSSNAWAPSDARGTLLDQAQKAGLNILSDGNDSENRGVRLINTSKWAINQNTPGTYVPTYNSTNPAYPYVFPRTQFGVESWRCAMTLRAGAVSVAEHTMSDGQKCATIIADSSAGRWVHMSIFDNGPIIQSAISWLTK